ncbi:helix-turn-helix domain-containing protein [Saccharibacillus deserti]|uniref:helix-turn-helix domain-containing protein n=1 Tax=Saccharibacillus deserti TaxID=1634444 RepID=UPI0031B61441
MKQIRNDRGLSQAGLAELAGMQDSYIGGVERGTRNISINSLHKIMPALDAEPIDAFRFGELEHTDWELEKQQVLGIHLAMLQERSLSEVKLVERMSRDMFRTYDEEEQE